MKNEQEGVDVCQSAVYAIFFETVVAKKYRLHSISGKILIIRVGYEFVFLVLTAHNQKCIFGFDLMHRRGLARSDYCGHRILA